MNPDLRKRAEEVLKQRGLPDKTLYEKDLESLVEELGIYQIELEQQNQELRDSQEELEKARNRWADLFNTAPVGYFILDRKSVIQDVNTTGCRLLGVDYGTLRGQNFEKHIHPDYQDHFYFHMRALMVANTPLSVDLKMTRNFGSVFDARLTSSSENVGYMDSPLLRITLTDISELKQAEAAVIHGQRLSAIGELAYGVAHDLNNALQGILSSVDLALHRCRICFNKGLLQTIKGSSEDAAARVRQLQRFAGQYDRFAESSRLDFSSVIEDAVSQSSPLWKGGAEKAGVAINVTSELQEGLYIQGNAADLRLVFFNLIKNSVEALGRGGSITLKTWREGEMVCALVADTGEGMSAATAKRLFQPFMTTKGYEHGKGLGLSSAYAIIREHRGEILLRRSKPGEGTALEIRLPRAEEIIHPEDVFPSSGTPSGREDVEPKKILWVDDEKVIRMSGQAMLEELGHTAETAGTGKEALEMIRQNRYDLIITDLGMPEMNGWQVAAAVKDMNLERVRLAIITGWGNTFPDEKLKQNGVWKVLSKPVVMEDLERLIRSL
jgi:PAS domain S-box-containing protein